MKTGLDAEGAGAPDVQLPEAEGGDGPGPRLAAAGARSCEDLGRKISPTSGTKYYFPEGHGQIMHPAQRDGTLGLCPLDLHWGDTLEVSNFPGLERADSRGWVFVRVTSADGLKTGTMSIHVEDLTALPLERRIGRPLTKDSPRALELSEMPPLPRHIGLRRSDTHEDVARIMNTACHIAFRGHDDAILSGSGADPSP